MTFGETGPKAWRAAVALAVAVLLLVAAPGAAAGKKRRKARRPEPTAVPRPPDPTRVTIPTADGVALAASWRPLPGVEGAPAVLLVHDFSRDRREWDALVPELTDRGFSTLAIDLRGHGESTKRNGQAVTLGPSLLREPNAFPRDVQAACVWLERRSSAVGIAGVSLGGQLAVIATASGWAEAGVAISANGDRLPQIAGARPTAGRNLLVLAAEQDPGRAASGRALYAAATGEKKLALYPGAAHNLGLFVEHPAAKDSALDWLAALLDAKAVVPPTPVPEPPRPEPVAPAPPRA